MVLKLFSYGIIGYIKRLSNVFDALIVAFSVYELMSDSGSSGITIFRGIRLFRFIRILKKQIQIMLKTFANVAAFSFLFSLFMFIFRYKLNSFNKVIIKVIYNFKIFLSILGMNLFACKFFTEDQNGLKVFARSNFDSLYWSSITVFQVDI